MRRQPSSSRPRLDFEELLAIARRGDIPALRALASRIGPRGSERRLSAVRVVEQTMGPAVDANHTDFLECALQLELVSSFALEYEAVNLRRPLVLEWLRATDRISLATCTAAAMHGRDDVIAWLVENNLPVDHKLLGWSES